MKGLRSMESKGDYNMKIKSDFIDYKEDKYSN